QHPATPVTHAVRRRPRAIEREEGNIDHRDEERGRPHRPRLSEDEPILRAEQKGHRAGFYRETTSRFQNYGTTSRKRPIAPAQNDPGRPRAKRPLVSHIA